jgi:hypothetical protein
MFEEVKDFWFDLDRGMVTYILRVACGSGSGEVFDRVSPDLASGIRMLTDYLAGADVKEQVASESRHIATPEEYAAVARPINDFIDVTAQRSWQCVLIWQLPGYPPELRGSNGYQNKMAVLEDVLQGEFDELKIR